MKKVRVMTMLCEKTFYELSLLSYFDTYAVNIPVSDMIRHIQEDEQLMQDYGQYPDFQNNMKLVRQINPDEYAHMTVKEWYNDNADSGVVYYTFEMEDALIFAFRGSEKLDDVHHKTGWQDWKDNFRMFLKDPTWQQILTLHQIQKTDIQKPFYMCGHSKGGNLAVYSGMKCAPFVQKRIQKIYSLDGPGFRPEVLKECHYNAIEGKVVKLLPHSSMIGMIFERDIHYRVVESNSHGLLQHDPFSWLVEEDHFVDVGDIYESQKIINEALNEWILSLNEEQVRTFVETLYQVISASQADDLITFTADWKKSMNAVVTALKEVDDQTAEMLRGIIRSLFEIAKVKVREELAPAKKPGRRFRNKKKEEKAEAHRPVPEDAPDATAAQGSAARHAPRLRGSRHRGSAE